LLAGRRVTAKVTDYLQIPETLAEWKELFPMEAYEVEPELGGKRGINIDLGLDQMEDYEPT
jgi:hypothetical protein